MRELEGPVGRYVEIPPGDPERLMRALAARDWHAALHELLGLALHGYEDWPWVQARCIELLDHEDVDLRCMAATSLGHLARVHRVLDQRAVVALRQRASDPVLAGFVGEALSDYEWFVNGHDISEPG